MLQNAFYVLIGGGIGSFTRYLLTSKIATIASWQIPIATLLVNFIGSFLIACFYALSSKFALDEHYRLLLTTGLCGGFTTFSTFSYENVKLLQSGQWHLFAIYALSSLILCILGAFVGVWAFSNR